MRMEKKERFGIFDVKSIPFLENRIAEIRDMLKSKHVIDKEMVAVLESMLLADEKRLNYLRAKQK
jgi:pyruvate/2-oxoacid:ferredoxin oxidoreductase alpha subunit